MTLRKHANVATILLITTTLAAPAFAIGAPFTEMDTNGDNKLSKQELVAFFGTDGAERVLKSVDKDKDGAISWEEAENAEAARENDSPPVEDVEIDLDDIDLNGDGEVSWEELTSIFSEEDAAEIMELLTDDSDRSVTEAELLEAIAIAMLGDDADDPEQDAIYLDDADKDNNGDLTKQELTDHFGAEIAAEIFSEFDVDKDGTVTDAEFESVVMAGIDEDEGDEEIDLYAVDLNADGKITKEELEAFIGDDAAVAIEHFDDDGDGVISIAELDMAFGDLEPDANDDDDAETGDPDTDGDIDLTEDELALIVSQAIADIIEDELDRLSDGSAIDADLDDTVIYDDDDAAWDDDHSSDEDWSDDDYEMDDSDQS